MRWLDRRIDNFIRGIRDNPRIKRIPIGPNPDDPTMWRWFVIPRNRFFNVHLHNIRQDDPEHLHDHRMFNISLVLQGGYCEERFVRRPTEGLPLPATQKVFVFQRRPKFRLPSTPHRIVLRRDPDGRPVACWSLFIGLPHCRNWGFWTDSGFLKTGKWLSWQQYTVSDDTTSVGYGSRAGAKA